MILIVDNYDSFTYNLVQGFGQLGADVVVCRNDRNSVDEVAKLSPRAIVLSPGPSTPGRAGISVQVVRAYAGKIPILGVGLGHQCIGEAFGAQVTRAVKPMHGKTCQVYHDGGSLYKDIPSPFVATCYHSLLLDPATLPPDLQVTARTASGEVMGVRHQTLDVEGVQFHPESIMTQHGMKLLDNFLRRVSRAAKPA